MSAVATILAIEDEAPIRRFIKAYLEGRGFSLLEAATASQGLAMAASHQPEVILLDLGLPDGDGIDVIRRLREWSQTPIIVLSARDQEKDKVAGLDAGADDYLVKPFGVSELEARVRVALRHAALSGGEGEAVFESEGLRIDFSLRKVVVDGSEVKLTPIEFKLLSVMARHAGKVVTHAQLLREVWGRHTPGEQAHYVRIYVHQLRHKIEREPARPVHLKTETGVGYRLE